MATPMIGNSLTNCYLLSKSFYCFTRSFYLHRSFVAFGLQKKLLSSCLSACCEVSSGNVKPAIPRCKFSRPISSLPTENICLNTDNNNKQSNDRSLKPLSDDLSENFKRCTSFTDRTHMCGEVCKDDIGSKIILSGWVQHTRMSGQFVVLRDAIGTVQIIIPLEQNELLQKLANLPLESVIRVEGQVRLRPEGQANKYLKTGGIEVVAENVQVLNECTPTLPFQIHDHHVVKESLRLRYRYLEMRGHKLQADLRFRSQIIQRMRHFLTRRHGFIDVETPTLFRRTPGGAREFIVPTHATVVEGEGKGSEGKGSEGRGGEGLFYSLPQSPQQFKQLLMVGAIDRYMQIARCYRDESSKPDRQPEFTQLDLEMSFITQSQIMNLIEQLIKYCWPVIGSTGQQGRGLCPVNQTEDSSSKLSDWMREDEEEFIEQGRRLNLPPLVTPFPRMNYEDALSQYGTDKPDTRFESRLVDLTQAVRDETFEPFSRADSVQAVVFSAQDVASLSRAQVDELSRTVRDFSRRNGSTAVKSCSVCRVKSDGSWTGGLEKNLHRSTIEQISKVLSLSSGQLFVVVAGERVESCLTAGRFRTETRNLTHPDTMTGAGPRQMNFLWVENFPMFLPNDAQGTAVGELESAHHPFTAPHPDDLDLLIRDPLSARSQHYDLVLNGCEVGGGSIRIHDATLQRHVLSEILKENPEPLNHLLEALHSGCPPHGGIALGLDRLLSLLCGTSSVRDVIAFPKSSEGKCLMSGAPAPVSKEDKEYYGISGR